MATSKSLKMTTAEKRIVGFTAVAHGLNHAVELVFGAVLLVVAFEFDARIALLGAIANGASLSYSLMALPAGQFADRWGSKRMVALSMAPSSAMRASNVIWTTSAWPVFPPHTAS